MGLIIVDETPKPDSIPSGYAPCPNCYCRYFVHHCDICKGERCIAWVELITNAERIKELCGEERYQRAVEQSHKER